MTDILGVERTLRRPGLRSIVARRVLRDRVLRRMSAIEAGSITIREGDYARRVGASVPDLPDVDVRIVDPRFWPAMAFGGSVGAGESYARGFWDCSDLTACLSIFVRNRATLEDLDRGTTRLTAPLRWAFHKLRPNSKRGSRRNIAAHYDLGNDFFSLWLDPSMTYSAAVFEEDALDPRSPVDLAGLERAQVAKLDRLCSKLQLKRGDEVCEIGTGWGSMALHLAREYGCRVTTTTISRRQADFARRRIREEGLHDRIELLESDYRELCAPPPRGRGLAGRFDALVSIEMIEAVGHRYLPDYFETCSALLKPDGRMALQAITIAEQHFELAKRSVDFIQRFVFPGCAIPSIGSISRAIARRGDFRIVGTEDLAPHYARTLQLWRERFEERSAELDALGYDRFFRRLWEFYFAYCEAGFAERQLGLQQMVLARAASRRLQPVEVAPAERDSS